MLLPVQLILVWMLGLFSLLVPGLALFFLLRSLRPMRRPGRPWPHPRSGTRVDHVDDAGTARPPFGATRVTIASPPRRLHLLPLLGLALLLFAFTGRYWFAMFQPAGSDEPRDERSSSTRRITRPDGTTLQVEFFGPADAPPIILTHGWTLDSRAWFYAKHDLAGRFRLIAWDLRGLGKSTQPTDRDYSLERMAEDLGAVLALAQGKPAILVGHSIGGMINLTYCRLHPEQMGHAIAGLVQVDTTYTNPVNTTKDSDRARALQKPVFEPLLHLTIWLSPVVRLMNWLSYQNGTAHMLNASSSFAGTETWGQLDFVSRFNYRSSPAVSARGMLAMLRWDATPVLPHVTVPVLILEGQQDTTTLPSASETMRATIPSAELRLFQPAAHLGPIERHAEYDEAMARFAAKLQETRGQ